MDQGSRGSVGSSTGVNLGRREEEEGGGRREEGEDE